MSEIIFNTLPGQGGNIGEIVLNRPKALNALTLPMFELMYQQLAAWDQDNGIKAVIIKSNDQRAFCAGGDIRQLYGYRDKQDIDNHYRQFFLYEYSTNALIYHFHKPYISFLDGITMGGGVGVSVHGSHRIATENFMFAMPETVIGFFPDIGAAHFLARCPYKAGWYLGLTGEKIAADSALELGIINHYVSSDALEKLQQDLQQTEFSGLDHALVSDIIERYQAKPIQTEFLQHKKQIERCFSQLSFEQALKTLQRDDWGEAIVKQLMQRSPTSLLLTYQRLQRASHHSFDQVIQTDFDIVQTYLHQHDFFEGIRALLIDKDKNPQWQPKTLAEVSELDLAEYFRPKGHYLLNSPRR